MDSLEEYNLKPTVNTLHRKDVLLTYTRLSKTHWERLRAANVMEWLKRKRKPRFDVAGVLSDRDLIVRLDGSNWM